jgi:addiction module HigA family antidote
VEVLGVSGSINNGGSFSGGKMAGSLTYQSPITTNAMSKKGMLPLIHPGEILIEEFIRPLGLTLAAVSRATGIPGSRLTEITKCRRSITAETALRLAKFFGTTPGFWVGLQAEHDLEAAERELGARVEKEVIALSK